MYIDMNNTEEVSKEFSGLLERLDCTQDEAVKYLGPIKLGPGNKKIMSRKMFGRFMSREKPRVPLDVYVSICSTDPEREDEMPTLNSINLGSSGFLRSVREYTDFMRYDNNEKYKRVAEDIALVDRRLSDKEAVARTKAKTCDISIPLFFSYVLDYTDSKTAYRILRDIGHAPLHFDAILDTIQQRNFEATAEKGPEQMKSKYQDVFFSRWDDDVALLDARVKKVLELRRKKARK